MPCVPIGCYYFSQSNDSSAVSSLRWGHLCNINLILGTMGKTFGLRRRKYDWMTKVTGPLLISIPLDKVSLPCLAPTEMDTDALVVSIPRDKVTVHHLEPAAAHTISSTQSGGEATTLCSPSTLGELKSKLALSIPEWVAMSPECVEGPPVIILCRPVCHFNANAIIKYTLRIECDGAWNVWLHDKRVELVLHPVFFHAPKKVSTYEELLSVITTLENTAREVGEAASLH